MKKLILLSSLLLMPFSTVLAQEDIQSQIDQLKTEIATKQSQIIELKQSLSDGQDTVRFEHEGLSFEIQIESTDSVDNYILNKDLFLILNISVTNTTDSAIAFDASNFNMYLAEVAYNSTHLIGKSMDKQAIPEFATVEGQIHFDLTEAVSNSKDLIIRYQPSDSIFAGETIFEFKINEYKRIKTAEDVVHEPTPNQTVQKEPAVTSGIIPATELTQDEIYSAIEDAYYNDLQNDYYNAPETIYYEEQPEVWEDGPGYEEYWGPSTPQFEGQLSPEEMADLE